MQKLLPLMAIAILFVITSSAQAGGVKVPKELCIVPSGPGARVQLLAFKAVGKLSDVNGKTKIYSVTGLDGYGVMSGSAIIDPDTSLLRATYSGQYGLASGATYSYELDYDLETGSGTLYKRVDSTDPDIDPSVNNLAVTETDCTLGPIFIGP